MRLVPVGVWIDECDGDYDIQVRARSSLFRKFDCILANGVGTIDSDYRDEIQVPLYNTLDHPVTVPAGSSLAQLVISSMVREPSFTVEETERSGGFGSTDKKRRDNNAD